MKVLLVTGQLAKNIVELYAKKSKIETQIIALNTAVAAFLTPENIGQFLKKINLKNIDVILVPGLVKGDTKITSKIVGIPTFKGSRYAADLPTVLNELGKTELSTVNPACEILEEKLTIDALDLIEKIEDSKDILLKKPGNMLIANLPVGKDFPMRVLAEIVDAPLMSTVELQRLTEKYVKAGADIIDIGMIAGKSQPLKVKKLVKKIKQVVNVPVSIDTLDPDEIKAGVSCGIDFVLSVDEGNLQEVAPLVKNKAVVIIPTNQKKGYFPQKLMERVLFLEEIINKAKKIGLTKIIADLIVDPCNIIESMYSYKVFANRNPDIPLFVGISNVTELIDADSIGVNAIMSNLASEVDGSIILATEKSDKAKGSVKEEVIAAKMMLLAKKRASTPKDLGLDLLVLKDKRNREYQHSFKEKNLKCTITADFESNTPVIDSKGVFRISIDRIKNEILAVHFDVKNEKVKNVIKGKTAEAIWSKIVELKLISLLDHAAYLGSELIKAEIALKTGKEYIQDKELFN